MSDIQRAQQTSSQLEQESSASGIEGEQISDINDIVKREEDEMNIVEHEIECAYIKSEVDLEIVKCEEELNIDRCDEEILGDNENDRLNYSDHSYVLPSIGLDSSENRSSSSVNNFESSQSSDNISAGQNTVKLYDLNIEFSDVKPLKCPVCGKLFTTKISLEYHMRSHEKIQRFACDTCSNCFDKKLLKTHLSGSVCSKTLVTHFQCFICFKIFESEENLTSHMKTYGVEDKFSCYECGDIYCDEHQFNIHIRAHIRSLTCEACGKIFDRNSFLKKKYFKNLCALDCAKPFMCFICDKFYDKNKIVSHMSTHVDKRAISCNNCSKVYPDLNQLGLHMQSHSNLHSLTRGTPINVVFKLSNKYSLARKALSNVILKGINEPSSKRVNHKKSKNVDKPNSDEPSMCLACNTVFERNDLYLHMKIHTDENIFLCKICGKVLSDKLQLKHHMRLHTNTENPVSCDACGKYCLRKSGLITHVKKSCKKMFICYICEEVFITDNLNLHMKEHASIKPYSCKACFRIFTEERELEFHMRSHTNKQPFECDACGSYFSTKVRLTKHVLKYNGKTEIRCVICDEYFSTCIKTHMLTCKAPSLMCPICNKYFPSRSGLRYHYQRHTDDKPFKCEICDKSYVVKGLLESHVRIHFDDKPFKCTKCDKCFHSSTNLNVHMRTHYTEKRFQCTVCGKCFAYTAILRRHLATHLSEKQHQCHICSMKFTLKDGLTKHLQSHSTEKPFQCSLCGKYFKNKRILKSHIFSHSKQKPFECSICKNRFTRKTNLNAHMLLHPDQ